MPQPEAALQRKIQQLVKNMGGYVLKVHGNQFTPVGTPDLIGTIDGVFFAIEVKTKSGQLSLAQCLKLRRIAACGAPVAVIRDYVQAQRFMASVRDFAARLGDSDEDRWAEYWEEEVDNAEAKQSV